MEVKLYVGNLSQRTTEEDLRMLFARVGMVMSVEIIRHRDTGKSKGYGFVEMVSQGDAGKAVSEYNGFNFDKRRIKVSVARARSGRSGRRDKSRRPDAPGNWERNRWDVTKF